MPRAAPCDNGVSRYARERKSLITSKKLESDASENEVKPKRTSSRAKKGSEIVVQLQSTSPVKKAKSFNEK